MGLSKPACYPRYDLWTTCVQKKDTVSVPGGRTNQSNTYHDRGGCTKLRSVLFQCLFRRRAFRHQTKAPVRMVACRRCTVWGRKKYMRTAAVSTSTKIPKIALEGKGALARRIMQISGSCRVIKSLKTNMHVNSSVLIEWVRRTG